MPFLTLLCFCLLWWLISVFYFCKILIAWRIYLLLKLKTNFSLLLCDSPSSFQATPIGPSRNKETRNTRQSKVAWSLAEQVGRCAKSLGSENVRPHDMLERKSYKSQEWGRSVKRQGTDWGTENCNETFPSWWQNAKKQRSSECSTVVGCKCGQSKAAVVIAELKGWGHHMPPTRARCSLGVACAVQEEAEPNKVPKSSADAEGALGQGLVKGRT